MWNLLALVARHLSAEANPSSFAFRDMGSKVSNCCYLVSFSMYVQEIAKQALAYRGKCIGVLLNLKVLASVSQLFRTSVWGVLTSLVTNLSTHTHWPDAEETSSCEVRVAISFAKLEWRRLIKAWWEWLGDCATFFERCANRALLKEQDETITKQNETITKQGETIKKLEEEIGRLQRCAILVLEQLPRRKRSRSVD